MARVMKDSGIEWIGEVPTNWEIGRNKNCFSCSKQIVGNSSSRTQLLSLTTKGVIRKDINSVGGKLPESFDTYQLVDKDDMVMCLFDLDCSAVFSGLSHTAGMISPAYKVLKCRDCYSPKFADYWFRFIFDKRKFIPYAKNLRYTLSYDEFGVLPIVNLPMDEQNRIADFLDTKCAKIDSAIEKTRKTIEEYKALKQSIITEAVTKGIRGDRSMKDSGIEWIGDIPADWDVLKITRILDYSHPYPIGDGDHGLIKTESYVDKGIPYLRVQNLGWGTELSTDGLVFISKEDNEKIKNSTLIPNDILFAKTGATIGKTGIVPETMPISNTTSHIGKITVSSCFNPKYVFYVLSSFVGYRQFWEIAMQKTTRPELSIEEIKSIRIILPNDIIEQNEIVEYIDAKCTIIQKIIEKKEYIVQGLESYKKSLIYECVTGKKEVV